MANATTVLAIEHIVQTPGILGGRPRIAGRRVPVSQVADLYARQSTSIEEIAEMLNLTISQVHAALSYYFDHQAEIDAVIEDEQRYVAEHYSETPRLLKRNPEDDQG